MRISQNNTTNQLRYYGTKFRTQVLRSNYKSFKIGSINTDVLNKHKEDCRDVKVAKSEEPIIRTIMLLIGTTQSAIKQSDHKHFVKRGFVTVILPQRSTFPMYLLEKLLEYLN